MFKNWRKRYLVVNVEEKTVAYYGDSSRTVFRNGYKLNPSSTIMDEGLIDVSDGKQKFALSLKALKGSNNPAESTLLFACEDEAQKDEWKNMIHEIIYGVTINIPSLINEKFHVSTEVSVKYKCGNHDELKNNPKLSPEQTSEEPDVRYTCSRNVKHCLMLVNPDPPQFLVPSRIISIKKVPSRHWVHWVVANIPGEAVSSGDVLLPYVGSCPIYRCLFFLALLPSTSTREPNKIFCYHYHSYYYCYYYLYCISTK